MGADPHARDSEGLTPADLADESGYHTCADFLRNCEPVLPQIEVCYVDSKLIVCDVILYCASMNETVHL